MSLESEQAAATLRGIWQHTPEAVADLETECSPTKVCRNMKDITFDGYATDGEDMATAWRNTLAREGKLSGNSLADLVFRATD
jgi:hypothetical protein